MYVPASRSFSWLLIPSGTPLVLAWWWWGGYTQGDLDIGLRHWGA
jgi:hypothetical protein